MGMTLDIQEVSQPGYSEFIITSPDLKALTLNMQTALWNRLNVFLKMGHIWSYCGQQDYFK